MAVEKPVIPPTRKPVAEYQTPSPSVVFYTELVNRTDPAYVQNAPVKRGTLYSSIVGANQDVIAAYPNLYFTKERKLGQNDQLVFWDWATVPNAEDTYNSEATYVSDAIAYPAFTRVYTVRRDVYDVSSPIALGTPLTALIGVEITNGGLGYTTATGSIFGTDVEIQFVISNGVIISGIVVNEGTGITSNSVINISGDGQGASVAPIVQPTTCVLTSQRKQELADGDPLRNEFVRVIRTYETLPGPPITETRIDQNGDITTFTRTRVVASSLVTTNVIAGGIWTRTYQVPTESQYVAVKTVEVRNTQNELPFYSVEIPNLIPQEFRAFIPTTTTETTEIGTASLPPLFTDPPVPPYGAGDLFRSERQLDDYTFRRTITGFGGITLPQTHCNKETTEVFGGGILNTCITLELVGTGTIDEGLLVVRSSITDLGNGMEIKLTSSLDDTAWPILYGTHIDFKYLIEVDIQKQTVAAGTVGGVLPDGTIVEVNPHDKWRSIQISSKLNADTLPEDTQWFSGQNHSFPPELTDSIIQWAFAECGCSFSFSAMLQANMLQYTGAVKTRITEQFYNGAPPDDVTITQFFPQAHNFGFAWASACGDTDGNCRTKSGAPLFHIPLCLHDDLALSVGANTWTFAATSPAALPHGDYIMLPPHVERWRFGVFRRLLIEVLVP